MAAKETEQQLGIRWRLVTTFTQASLTNVHLVLSNLSFTVKDQSTTKKASQKGLQAAYVVLTSVTKRNEISVYC